MRPTIFANLFGAEEMTQKRNRRFNRNIRKFLTLSAVWLAVFGNAYAAAPDETVRDTTSQVLAAIGSSSSEQQMRQVVEAKVVPHFDFRRMTQLAAGRVWAQATPDQQDRISGEFQRLLVRTYARALAESEKASAKVTVQAPRAADSGGETTVRTKVSRPGAQPLAIDYRMANVNGDWKVIDVMVENISLVSNYRDWFATQAAAGGIDSVIKALQAKNQKAA